MAKYQRVDKLLLQSQHGHRASPVDTVPAPWQSHLHPRLHFILIQMSVIIYLRVSVCTWIYWLDMLPFSTSSLSTVTVSSLACPQPLPALLLELQLSLVSVLLQTGEHNYSQLVSSENYLILLSFRYLFYVTTCLLPQQN